jgi:hypothetical protein
MDDFDKSATRNTIQDFLLIEKRVPMILKLLPIIKEKNTCSMRPEVFRQNCEENGM